MAGSSSAERGTPGKGRPEQARVDRSRYIPISIALGLFVGDLLTLLLRGDLALGRIAASGVTSVIAYVFARWFVARRSSRR